jgi:formylglycine-generating enzyme required for sulfatase activity
MTLSLNELETRYTNQLESLRTELQAHIQQTNNVDKLLADNSLESKLVQFIVLNEGTSKHLAQFASINDVNEVLLDQILNDTSLLNQVLIADGARTLDGSAQYGPAIQIYSNILNRSEHAEWGGHDIYSRLALAISLEHAVPIEQNNPKDPGHVVAAIVDPVKRYFSYETAYRNGELDPSFDTLSTWELRFVVDGNEPDGIASWGRSMLRNYRPDHVLQRRYVRMVNSNIRYGSQDVKYDKDELQQYQNILMNGGVCGRRAFFGRFILRSFGIPTTARPSKGHGALVHWTDGGWVVALGGNWGVGWTKTLYHKDVDFQATTQARAIEEAYWAVKKAQWMGDVMGEQRVYGEHDVNAQHPVGFWNSESLKIQRSIINAFPNGNAMQRPHCSNRQLTILEQVLMTPIPSTANKTVYSNDRSRITIPAASYQNPNKTKDVQIMQSFQGGYQIYLPSFLSQGLTILRGGTWKNDHNGCCSGARIMSGGFGKYEDWGFRLAISVDDTPSCPASNLTVDIAGESGTATMEFVYIEPGTFLMGGESTSDGRFQCVEVPQHRVQITRGFYLGKYPVTQAQYEALTGSNPSKTTKAPDCPVDSIAELDAINFCAKLVETVGRDFRLPTEAEWEYACRAGRDTKWFFGDDPSRLNEFAWFKENSGGRSHPVGQLKPNPFGLYDMYGNVYERVSDKYARDYYSTGPSVDPTGPIQGSMSMFEYKVHIERQGTYKLIAEVVTANARQRLIVSSSYSESTEIVIELPFTNGSWQETRPVEVVLHKGENTLKFWRDNPPQYGVTVRQFTLEFYNDCNP